MKDTLIWWTQFAIGFAPAPLAILAWLFVSTRRR